MRNNALSYFYTGKARGSWSETPVRQGLHLTNTYSVAWHTICVLWPCCWSVVNLIVIFHLVKSI